MFAQTDDMRKHGLQSPDKLITGHLKYQYCTCPVCTTYRKLGPPLPGSSTGDERISQQRSNVQAGKSAPKFFLRRTASAGQAARRPDQSYRERRKFSRFCCCCGVRLLKF
jgi:hypothetical protein